MAVNKEFVCLFVCFLVCLFVCFLVYLRTYTRPNMIVKRRDFQFSSFSVRKRYIKKSSFELKTLRQDNANKFKTARTQITFSWLLITLYSQCYAYTCTGNEVNFTA